MQRITLRQLSQHGTRQCLRRFQNPMLARLTWSLTPRWLSQRGVSFTIDSVYEEWDPASTESPPNYKKFECVCEFKNKSKILKSPIFFSLYRFDLWKKPEQKFPCKCTFNIAGWTSLSVWRPLLKEIKQAGSRRIVLDCAPENIQVEF